MSTLYLATDQAPLANRLADELDAEVDAGDFFCPSRIVVPNRYLGKWLRLWLARTRGIAINLRFSYLETAMWDMLREQDPRVHPLPLGLVSADEYRLMVLSALLGEKPAAELASLRHYFSRPGEQDGRATWRRAWQLADRLSRLVRDYEYHRQDAIIQHWLRGELGYPAAGEARVRMEQGQREVFHEITRLPDGKRELLGQALGKLCKTLPQYAMEIMEMWGEVPRLKSGVGGVTGPAPASLEAKKVDTRPVHIFGIAQVSPLHLHTLRWLSERSDFRLYHLNPLARLLPAKLDTRAAKTALQTLAQRFRGDESPPAENELLGAWGRAAAESLSVLADLLKGSFGVELIDKTAASMTAASMTAASTTAAPSSKPTVLAELQASLRAEKAAPQGPKRAQDTSVQIVACPGVYREVETVYNSILHNLHTTPGLKQTDIAVLVTEMTRYRPVIQGVFEREPRRVLYNLADFSAAGMSAFGQALLGFLDLALEAFTRSRVLNVLLSPCFLARLNLDRAQAATWLTWAEELGIYHGWNARDKAERGYTDSPLFGWQLALRRLRLGRVMEAPAQERDEPAPRFCDIIPFADLASTDKEQLDVFCRAVEGLLPTLGRLRHLQANAQQWAGEILRLLERFLAIPPDRPEEAQVRDQVLAVLEQLRTFDRLTARTEARPQLPLALIREFIADGLESLEGAKGEYLTGGVTISALQPFRPVPFRIIYLLGLGEDVFPGTNALPTFDMRSWERLPGDIRPADQARNLFLEAILAARDKIYLLYPSRDLQRDQELHPGTPVNQLRRFLERHVTHDDFEIAAVPLAACDSRYLVGPTSTRTDVVANYSEHDILLGLEAGRKAGDIELGPILEKETARRWEARHRDFTIAAGEPEPRQEITTVTLPELRRFLVNPAEAGLRRHLGLMDEEEQELLDEEPFVTDYLKGMQLVRRTVEGVIQRAVTSTVKQAVAEWPARFAALYDDWRLRCRVPEGAFADLDQAALARTLQDRISGAGGLADFLARRQHVPFVGPILFGEPRTPVQAHIRFPALTLKLPDASPLFGPVEARVAGAWNLAWYGERAVDFLAFFWGKDKVSPFELSKPLLEPVLAFLALQASDVPGMEGISGRDWLAGRALRVHVVHARGIVPFAYSARTLSPERARDYLENLVTDFLDSSSFDLLPLDVIVKQAELRKAYADNAKPSSVDRSARRAYRARLEELIAFDQENEYSQFRYPELFDLVQPAVPANAWLKVRRRLRLLDRGPARNRLKERNSGASPAREPRPAHRS